MRTPQFTADAIESLLREQKIANMEQLTAALGTSVKRTVFRKLKEVGYRTSYSHRGSYYTLDDIPDFDEEGLWSYQTVWFSRHGTLLSTVENLVDASEYGHFIDELDNLLHVATKDAVNKLVREGRLTRQKVGSRYLYGSAEPVKRKQQVLARKAYAERQLGGPMPDLDDEIHDELKAAIILFFCLLDEKQRRLYAGLESLKMGHGGDRRMAALLGLSVGVVARGRRELVERDVEIGRIRKEGAGRKPVEKKRRK